jgi:hypothetical protein
MGCPGPVVVVSMAMMMSAMPPAMRFAVIMMAVVMLVADAHGFS